MSNIYDFGVNGQFPSKVGGTGATVKYFPRLIGSSSSGVQGPLFNNAPSTPSSSSAVGALFLPAQNTNNGQQLDVLATGSFGNDTGDPSGTVNIKLYVVTGSLSSPTYTAVASTGALTPSALGIVNSWAISAELYGDSGSGILGGSYAAYQNGALVNSTIKSTDTTVSGLNFLSGNSSLYQGAVCGFVVGVTFGTSDASNTASLYEFTIES
jgi:hypothetical protein